MVMLILPVSTLRLETPRDLPKDTGKESVEAGWRTGALIPEPEL